MNTINIVIETVVNPTEDIDKVKIAVGNLLYKPKFEIIPSNREKKLFARAEGREALKKIYDRLKKERIRDAARRVMKKGLHEKKNNILRKQAGRLYGTYIVL